MPVLTERDYTKLANAAAQDLVQQQIPLNTSLAKLARAQELNYDQLTRLCETTNNTVFNTLFNKMGADKSADRLVEFEVAKPAEVWEQCSETIKKAHAPTSTLDLAWESRSLVPTTYVDKTAAAAAPLEDLPVKAPSRLALEKAAETLRMRKIAATVRSESSLHALIVEFRKEGRAADYDLFEKEAMTLHGPDSVPLLDYMRSALRLPERTATKSANFIVLSTDTPTHAAFTRVVTAAREALEIEDTLANIKEL